MTFDRSMFLPSPEQKRALARASAAGEGLPAPRRYIAWIALMLGLTLAVLDGTIVNLALPSIAAHLGADAATSIWIVNAYQLAIVMTLLPLATLADIHGHRIVYLGGIALFTLASLACAFSSTLPALVAARAVQGLGAAGLMAVNLSVLRHTVPRARFGAAVGINALVVAIASTIGPVTAGLILAVADWHWLFLINIPLGLLTILFGWLGLPESVPAPRRFDWIAAALSAFGILLLITAVDGIGAGMPLAIVALQLAAAAACFTIQIRYERGSDRPMLPVDLLRIPAYALSICTSIAAFVTQFLGFVAIPFVLQSAMNFTPTEVGLMMMAWPLAVAVTAPFAGRLSDRTPPAILGGIGLAALAIGMFALGIVPDDAPIWDICWRLALCGAGFGLFQSPNNRAMFDAAPMERSGAASGMLSTARLTGQSLGAALVALLLGRLGLPGAQAALLLGAGFSAFAALTSLSRLAVRRAR